MAANIIKLNQIDEEGLLAFLQSSFGLTLNSVTTEHAFEETFNAPVYFSGDASFSGNTYFAEKSYFLSGLHSSTDVSVEGNISGESLTIDNFDIPSGRIGSVNIGSMNLTGVPIYSSGLAEVAVALPSGTVFGIETYVNRFVLISDVTGDWMPYINQPTKVIMLCVSIGS